MQIALTIYFGVCVGYNVSLNFFSTSQFLPRILAASCNEFPYSERLPASVASSR